MPKYGIRVYESAELADSEGWTPAERAKEYITGAFQESLDYEADVTVMYTDTPDLPTEYYDQEAESCQPCEEYPCYTANYSPISYFSEWLECTGNPEGKDVSLLLTGAPNQTYGGNSRPWSTECVAQTGLGIPEIPQNYTKYGYSDGNMDIRMGFNVCM